MTKAGKNEERIEILENHLRITKVNCNAAVCKLADITGRLRQLEAQSALDALVVAAAEAYVVSKSAFVKVRRMQSLTQVKPHIVDALSMICNAQLNAKDELDQAIRNRREAIAAEKG